MCIVHYHAMFSRFGDSAVIFYCTHISLMSIKMALVWHYLAGFLYSQITFNDTLLSRSGKCAAHILTRNNLLYTT